MAAPDRLATSQLIDHLHNRTTDVAASDLRIPISYFIDEERAAAERLLLRGCPVPIAHRSEIPSPGSFISRDVLGVPLLVARCSDGSVAAYVNICRHRGGPVESDRSGSRKVFVCRYHGWAYDLDGGTLRNVPYGEYFESIDPSCNGLETLPVEEKHGHIWVQLTGEGVPLSDYLGEALGSELDALEMDHTEVFLERSFTLDINWKLVMDGALDTLHPRFLHPHGVGKLLETNTHVWQEFGKHGRLFSPRKRLNEIHDVDELPENQWRWLSSNTLVYPNSLFIIAPDHLECWTVWPSPTTALISTTNIRFLVNPERVNDQVAERIQRSWEILEQAAVNEDWPMEAAIQSNAVARPERSIIYGRNELPCQHFHRQLLADIE